MTLSQFFSNPFEYAEQNRQKELDRAQYGAVNVVEFDGELCISVAGTPVFPIDKLGIPYEKLHNVLSVCRETWIKYNSTTR